ncbi:hypothetical protein M0657_010014 [Pyricularia oryzae]|nr:hypothetical protein M9X92_009869 [Pyricularia oryzae]KAI7913493.1 hypothetical protein M0657_010014 [Pyricularia oryzae]
MTRRPDAEPTVLGGGLLGVGTRRARGDGWVWASRLGTVLGHIQVRLTTHINALQALLYKPLSEEIGEIRLIVVDQGNSADPITCSFDTVSLTDTPTPSYDALSYTWGEGDISREPIILDGTLLYVRANLYAALQAIRNSTGPVVLWIDAISINQSDLDERARQVRLMRDVFAKARRVLAWVVQELAVAQECWVLCGSSRRPFSDYISLPARLLPLMRLEDLETSGSVEASDLAGILTFTQMIDAVCQFRDNDCEIDLRGALEFLPGHACSDPRDKVYAILGLCGEASRAAIVPDYGETMTLMKLHRRVVEHCLDVEGNLTVLAGPRHFAAPEDGLPSWCPRFDDIDQWLAKDPLDLRGPGLIHPPSLGFIDHAESGPTRLVVGGYVADRIASLVDVYEPDITLGSPAPLLRLEEIISLTLQKVANSTQESNAELDGILLKEAVMSTLGWLLSSEENPPASEFFQDVASTRLRRNRIFVTELGLVGAGPVVFDKDDLVTCLPAALNLGNPEAKSFVDKPDTVNVNKQIQRLQQHRQLICNPGTAQPLPIDLNLKYPQSDSRVPGNGTHRSCPSPARLGKFNSVISNGTLALHSSCSIRLVAATSTITKAAAEQENRFKKMGFKTSLAAALLAIPQGLAHPHPVDEPEYQHHARPLMERSLDHCAGQFAEPEFMKRTIDRHSDEYDRLRRALGVEPEGSPHISKRDYISVSRIDHKSNKPVSKGMDLSSLFTDYGACMLMPAVDQGPLYVKGEEVRKDIKNGEKGIPMTLAIQVVDYQTCKVLPDAYVDIWSSNATGMYVGVQGYPGMGDPKDASILKGTTLRGVQPTDKAGVASFDTLMPGHYEGRATHIHGNSTNTSRPQTTAIVYLGATKLQNNTLSGGRAAHVGQLYFDQSLVTASSQAAPYNTNRMATTLNVRDFLFMQGANGDDPIVRYALVGDRLEDGLFAWIRFGVRGNANLPVNPAAFWTANGGVMNPTGPISKIGGGFGGWPGGKNKARAVAEAVADRED